MSDFLTVAEVYRMQHRLIEMFGGRHGVRDKGAVEAAVFRPQTGYYSTLDNHGFIDGNKRIAFTATDVFLRRNGLYLVVEGKDGHTFIDGSIARHEFRFAQILIWVRQHLKPLSEEK
jgi:death-on-curing protein